MALLSVLVLLLLLVLFALLLVMLSVLLLMVAAGVDGSSPCPLDSGSSPCPLAISAAMERHGTICSNWLRTCRKAAMAWHGRGQGQEMRGYGCRERGYGCRERGYGCQLRAYYEKVCNKRGCLPRDCAAIQSCDVCVMRVCICVS